MIPTKFRVWDKVTKRMLYYDKDIVPLMTLNGVLVDAGTNVSYRFILMQFTSKKDEKQVEICEDDICTGDYRCAVGFDFDPHELTGTIEQADNGLWMFDYGHGEIALDDEDLQNIEIIGNVHENPELLETK